MDVLFLRGISRVWPRGSDYLCLTNSYLIAIRAPALGGSELGNYGRWTYGTDNDRCAPMELYWAM